MTFPAHLPEALRSPFHAHMITVIGTHHLRRWRGVQPGAMIGTTNPPGRFILQVAHDVVFVDLFSARTQS